MTGATIPNERSKAALPVLFSVVIVDLIGFGIVVPVLPYWAREFGASGLELGLVQSSYALAQFAAAPLWGKLSDRIGRRPVMLLTIAGTAISLAALGFAGSLWGLFLARLCAGAFAANVSVATAYVADVTAEEERTRWMGMIGASFAVGFTLGPPIGGFLGSIGYAVPMFFAAGLAAVNGVVAFFALKEPEAHADRAAAGAAEPRGRFALLRDPTVRKLFAAYLLFSLAVTQLENMFQYYMIDTFQWDVLEVSWILFGMAIVMGGIQGGGMKRLAERYPERTLVTTGGAIMVLGFFFVPVPGSVAWLMAPLFLLAVGRGISQPSLMSLASFQAEASDRGAVMGTFQSAASLARIFGPALAGVLYDISRGLPFRVGAALMLAMTLLALGLPRGAGGKGPAASPSSASSAADTAA